MGDPEEPSHEAMDRALVRRSRAKKDALLPGRHLDWPARVAARALQLQVRGPDFGVSDPGKPRPAAPPERMDWAEDEHNKRPQRFWPPQDEAIGLEGTLPGLRAHQTEARAAAKTASAWDRLDDAPPVVPNAAVTAFLSSMLKLPAGKVEIYNGPAADALAESYAADAVTRRGRIAFRNGAFDPVSLTGTALLAHELSHATHRDAPGEHEEIRAQGVEAVVLDFLERTAPDGTPTAAHAPAAVETRASARPFPAAVARSDNAPWPAPSAPISGTAPPAMVHVPAARAAADRPQPDLPAPPPAVTEAQLESIKQAVYREILDRIRSDFERGG